MNFILFDKILNLAKWIFGKLKAFWQKLVEFLRKGYEKLKSLIQKAPEGVRTFVTKIEGSLKNLSRNFVKNDATKTWEEYTYTQKIDENQVPAEIRAQAMALTEGQELSTTQELDALIS